jgi:hypothetical protein
MRVSVKSPKGPASLDQPHVLPTREPVADDPPWEVRTPAELRAKTPPDPLFESDQNRRLRDIIDVEVRHRTFSSNSALSRAPAKGSPPSSAKAAAGTKTPIFARQGFSECRLMAQSGP